MAYLPTRRDFLSSLAVIGAGLRLAHAAANRSAQPDPESRLAADPMRPQFHLLPAKNWMNDPNGPIYFGGRYHMFFQYNPLGATWGNMSWNHAVSADMLHWTHLPIALRPTPAGPDSYGCFTGSAIQVGRRVYMVYTGTRESTPALATIRDGENRIQESQCLAWSEDSDLITWTKAPAPVIARPPDSLQTVGFRDPSAWKQGDWFYMTVGSGIARAGGCVLLYRSRDLMRWEYLHELTRGTWSGSPTPNPCDDGEMWECPEFFPLDHGHVLIYSTQGKVFWTSGVLNEDAMTFTPAKRGELDLGAYYAPKTQLDARGRRILWGWIPERRSEAAMRQAGWSGMMSLPRVLNLDADGTLRMEILPETAALRGEALATHSSNGAGNLILHAANGELLVHADSDKAFALTIHAGRDQIAQLHYAPKEHAFVLDGQTIPLKADDIPSLHAFVDGSVLEMILASRIGATRRFYYAHNAPDIEVRFDGSASRAQAWSVRPISPNRLTTAATLR